MKANVCCTNNPVPLIFLPGWAFDDALVECFQLFSSRAVQVPPGFVDPERLLKKLPALCSACGGRVDLVGWSMGARLALQFAIEHPSMVHSLTLLALRASWPVDEIAAIRHALDADHERFLCDFYRKCFLGYRRHHALFVRSLQSDYLRQIDPAVLHRGLDYLLASPASQIPPALPVTLIHGGKDVVAPCAEMARLPGATIRVIPRAGHMVLLDMDMTEGDTRR